MHIYNRKSNKYLSHCLKCSNKRFEFIIDRVSNNQNNFSFHIKIKENCFLTYTPVSFYYLNLQTDSYGTTLFYLSENKFLYVRYNNKRYYLTFSGSFAFFSAEIEKRENQLIEFTPENQNLCRTIFSTNNFRGIITDLMFVTDVENLNRILEIVFIYNIEDCIRNDVDQSIYGYDKSSIINYCEPCLCERKISVCSDSYGIILKPQFFGCTKIDQRDFRFCIIHFSESILENSYYHVSNEENNGFVIKNETLANGLKIPGALTYTDVNIKRLVLGNFHFELVVRNSISLSFMRHVTFFDIDYYQYYKEKLESFPLCSSSFR